VVVFAKQLDDRMTSIDTADKAVKIEKRQSVTKRIKRSNPTKVRPAWMDRHRAVRYRSGGQPLQDLEPDEPGSYFPPPVRAVTIPKRVAARGF